MIFAFAGTDGLGFSEGPSDPRRQLLSPYCPGGFVPRNGGCVQALARNYSPHGLRPLGDTTAPAALPPDPQMETTKAIIGGLVIGLVAVYLFSHRKGSLRDRVSISR